MELGWEKYHIVNVYLFIKNKDYSYRYTWMTLRWLERSSIWLPCGRNWWNSSILTNQLHFLITFFWDALNGNAKRTQLLLMRREKCLTHEFLLEPLKNCQGGKNLTQKLSRGPTIWKDVLKKCVERYCELANNKTEQLYKVSSPCLDDHQFKKEELESVGELSKVCSKVVLKYLYLARIGRYDILWSVNKLARSVTTWPRACDRRSASLIFIHSPHKWLPATLSCGWHCRLFSPRPWGLRTNGCESYVYLEVKHFVSICLMCKKQTWVSHSCTE